MTTNHILRNRLGALLPAYLLFITSIAAPAADLVPYPQTLTPQATPFSISAGTRIVAEDASLSPLATIVADEMYLLTGVQPATLIGTAGVGDIGLRLDGSLTNEAYALDVAGTTVVRGGNYAAVAMGTVTLLQAISGGPGTWAIPGMTVSDAPALEYRSLLIDLARQNHSISVLEQCVEMCRWYKIRYIQLHLTDDQAFTFPSTAYPQLASPSQSYSLQELEDLNTFATQRGVTLIPELEMPGHSGRMRQALPAVFGESTYGCLNMGDEDIYDALDTLIGEVLDVFEDSPYIHIGGDETWLGDIHRSPDTAPALTRWNLSGNTDLYLYFVHQMHLRVAARGKQTLVWEGFHGDGDFGTTGNRRSQSRDMIVMAWESRYNPAPNLINEGFTIINAAWRPLYVVGNRRWPAQHIYQDWNPWLIMHDQDSTYIQLQTSDPVMGTQMCAWEQRGDDEIPNIRERIAAMGERVWNPDAELTWSNYSARAAITDAKLEQIILPVTISADGLIAEDDNAFENALTITMSSDRPGTIRYTTNDTEPTTSSTAYGSPFNLSSSTTLRAKLFNASQPVGHAELQTFRKLTPKLYYKLYDTGPLHPTGLPDFDTLPAPERDSVTDTFTATHYDPPAPGFAMEMHGWINAPTENDYSLSLMSADGPSQLWIDGQLAVDRDVPIALSTDGISPHVGLVHLTPGLHRVRVLYLWDLFRRRLNVEYQTAGMGSLAPLANLLEPLSSVPHALPAAINFGPRDVFTGPTPARTIILTNTGIRDDLPFSSVSLSGTDAAQFHVVTDSGETNLPPGEARTLKLSFEPASTGLKSATLTFTSPGLPGGTTTVALTGQGSVAGDVVVSPSSLDFNSQDLSTGPTASQSLVISNASITGTAILNDVFLAGTHALHFHVASDTGQTSLAPGQTRTLQLVMDPASPGAKQAYLTVISNDTDTPTIQTALSGTGTGSLPAPVLKAHFAFEDASAGHEQPIDEETGNITTAYFSNSFSTQQTWDNSGTYGYAVYGHGNWSRIYLDSDGDTHISPLTKDFTLTVWFRTGTNNDVPIFSGDGWELRYHQEALTLLMKDLDHVPYAISAAESGLSPNTWNHIAVTFQDLGYNNYEARFTINGERRGPALQGVGKGSSAGGDWQIARMYPFFMDELRVYDGILSDDAIRALALEPPANAGEIDVTGGPFDFGPQELADGPSATQTATISNTHGSRSLNVLDVFLTGSNADEFGIASDSGQPVLGPGASRTVHLHFDPSTIDARRAELIVLSNDPDEDTIRIPLAGKGIDGVVAASGDIDASPPGPLTFAARDVTAGPSPAQSIVLANVDPSNNLAILNIQLAGPAATQFVITADTGDLLLPPGSNRIVQVAFDPSHSGAYTGILAVTSSDPNESPLEIQLLGTGTNAPSGEIQVTPAGPIHFGSLDVEGGASAFSNVLIENLSGTAALAVTSVTLAGPDAGEFGIASDSGETSLAPGSSRTLEIFFNPATVGTKTAQVDIASADIDEPTVSVTLTGEATTLNPPPILTVHLEMEETSGSHNNPIVDSTGNILSAKIDNTVGVQQTWDHSAEYGSAVFFPGSWGRYKLLADGDTVVSPLNQDFSLSVWVRPNLNGDPWHVFTSNNDGGGTYLGYALLIWSDGSVAFDTGANGSSFAYTLPPGTLSAGTWYHLALTFQDIGGGTNEARFYVDGAPTGGALRDTAAPGTAGNGWSLGASAPGMFAGSGYMDDFRLYSGILSFGNVAALALEDPNADRNNDGLPDAWQIKHFGDHTLAAAGPTLHGDADLTSNQDEYVAGTDPRDPTSYPKLTIYPNAGGALLQFDTRRSEGDGYAGRTRTYDIQNVTDLDMTWLPLAGQSTIPATDLPYTYSVNPAGEEDAFFRVHISLQ